MKRIIKFFCAMILAFSMFGIPSNTQAQERLSYVALGDSISTGYGLADPSSQNFVNVYANSNDYSLTNLANDGADSLALLSQIQNSSVSEADVITITVGGNDLINAFYSYIARCYNSAYSTSITGQDVYLALLGQNAEISQATMAFIVIENSSGFAGSSEASNALDAFAKNFQSAVEQIKKMNPNCQILVSNLYNPYAKFKEVEFYSKVVEVFESGVQMLNGILSNNAGVSYQLIDIYTPFLNSVSNPCNASLTNMNFDFHPNALGHSLIADAFGSYPILVNQFQEKTDIFNWNGSNQTVFVIDSSVNAVVESIWVDDIKLSQDNYIVDGNCITLLDQYLRTLEGANLHLTFIMSSGNGLTSTLQIPEVHRIQLKSDPEGAGTASVGGKVYSEYYVPVGDSVTISVWDYIRPYTFECWKEDGQVIGENIDLEYTPTKDTTLTMSFVEFQWPFSASPDKIDFGSVEEGYGDIKAQKVEIQGEIGGTLLVPENPNYNISEMDFDGEKYSFTIQPKAGLKPGNYDTTIDLQFYYEVPTPMTVEATADSETITYDTIEVSFEVKEKTSMRQETDKKKDSANTAFDTNVLLWVTIGLSALFIICIACYLKKETH